MLVLSRKLQEQILVGEVVITVLEIRGRWVKIGIDAPREVPIRREELQARESCHQRELVCGHA
jgi:carbon storage regulator